MRTMSSPPSCGTRSSKWSSTRGGRSAGRRMDNHMELSEISHDITDWFSGSGPLADIVVSSRIRLARNLAGHRFLNSCSNEEKAEILAKLKSVLMSLDLGDEVFYVSVDKEPELSRNFLVERHLISRHHAMATGPRGA